MLTTVALTPDIAPVPPVASSAGDRWYVVHTHVNCEAKAAYHLDRQDFKTYLPRYLKRRRHARKVDLVEAPLFPRYMFVAIDTAAQRWRSIKSTIGVANLICHGDAPVPVASSILDCLKQREGANGLIQLNQAAVFYPGDKIRVAGGVFSDALGLFEKMTDKERVAVLLDVLGRKVRVLMDLELVEPR